MNPREIQDAQRISRVIRATRKLHGKNQTTVANLLGVSQAAVSTIEAGQKLPSTSQWFHFCEHFGLEAEPTYRSGMIDPGPSAVTPAAGASSPFRVPKKYLRYQGSKVRAMQPFLRHFENQAGKAKLEAYLAHAKIDPDFFLVYDNQLNLRFTLDLVTTMIDRGYLKQESVPELTRLALVPQVHGKLHQEYSRATTRKDLLKTLIQNIKRYDLNFVYTLLNERTDRLMLSVAPDFKLRHVPYRTETLGSFLCDYKKHYLSVFSSYLGGRPVAIQEHECHFRGGGKQCLYELHLTA